MTDYGLVGTLVCTPRPPHPYLPPGAIAWEALRSEGSPSRGPDSGVGVKLLFCGRPRALRVETSPTCSRISQPRSKSKCFKFMDNVRNHRSPAQAPSE